MNYVNVWRKREMTFDKKAWEKEEQWSQKYQELITFKAEHQHLDVVAVLGETSALGKWVLEQQKQHTEGTLESYREGMLNILGFNWEQDTWMSMYHELARSARLIGTANSIVDNRERKGYKLYQWSEQQRLNYKKNRLTPKQIQLLEEIGFEWDLKKKVNSPIRANKTISTPICEEWMIFFNRLKQYYEENQGNLERLKSEDSRLYKWVRRESLRYMRNQMRAAKKDLFHSIQFDFDKAIQQLGLSGFENNDEYGKQISRYKGINSKWLTSYDKFKTLYEYHEGDLLAVKNEKKEFYRWALNQVKSYQAGGLSSDRAELLMAIKYDFKAHLNG